MVALQEERAVELAVLCMLTLTYSLDQFPCEIFNVGYLKLGTTSQRESCHTTFAVLFKLKGVHGKQLGLKMALGG